MESTTQTPPVSKGIRWAGIIFTGLAGLVFFMAAAFPFINPAAAAQGNAHMGYPANTGVLISVLAAVSAIIYLVPRTSVLGAVLLTGYLGGATASHIRIGEAPIPPLVVAGIVWLGIYLREPRLRALLPLRK